uniref:C-type lectin domain-containing protein n=1 Tax=Periophthalmus magnuspinnatus TaxID=409849 RepID=A0A3B4ACZ7_9GOBI
MAPHIILPLLLFAVSSSSLKYEYVEVSRYWTSAQQYCRSYYTDLATVSSAYDVSLLQQAADSSSNKQRIIWFGLIRNTTDWNKWMWSGGGEVTSTFWDTDEPASTEIYGLLIDYKWHGAYNTQFKTHFLCYKVHVVKERMVWEDALKFCRGNHQDLASVASETEMMLMQSELLKHVSSTEYVWVGLRFLADRWMWVDRQPLVYDAWGPNEQPWCPAMRCGALKVTGTLWNSRDCNEKLKDTQSEFH